VKRAKAMKRTRGVGLALLGALWCCSSALASSGGAAPAREPAHHTLVAGTSSAAAVFARTLRKGQSGTDIKTLQKWLSDVGYQVPATGYFGTITRAAVRRFQLTHRLYPASGSVGDRTSSTLRATVLKATKGQPTSAARTNPAGSDPIPGFKIERDDMGVDASAQPGAGIYAPVASSLVQVMRDWYAGEPLLLFQFLNPPPGALSDYWYVAEQIDPVTTTIGTTFQAGQRVASFASSGTDIEIGWGSPTSNSRTLADETDPGAADPPAGSTTIWGESFKKFFGIK
jgi:peptidoglycan hydrolase-like protein with peptidoglycan-binding domain